MPFAQIRDIRMYYEQRGSGPRLLYISGTGGDLRAGRVFEGPLAEAFDLLAYDQRGLGQTDKPDVPYTMADYAEDAAALDHSGTGRPGWDRARSSPARRAAARAESRRSSARRWRGAWSPRSLRFARYAGARRAALVLACTSSGGWRRAASSSTKVVRAIPCSELERSSRP